MKKKDPTNITDENPDRDQQRLKETFFSTVSAKERYAIKPVKVQLIQTQDIAADPLPVSSFKKPENKTETNQQLTFNSLPQQEKIRPKRLPKILILVILAGIIIAGLSTYQIIIVPRAATDDVLGAKSLLWNNSIVSFSGQNSNLVGQSGNLFLIPITAAYKTAVNITLDSPINLNQNNLSLYLKNLATPATIGVVIKDTNFHSNSLHPVIITITPSQDKKTIIVPISFKGSFLQNTNLSRIRQVSLLFYPGSEKNLNWVLLNDLVATKSQGGNQ